MIWKATIIFCNFKWLYNSYVNCSALNCADKMFSAGWIEACFDSTKLYSGDYMRLKAFLAFLLFLPFGQIVPQLSVRLNTSQTAVVLAGTQKVISTNGTLLYFLQKGSVSRSIPGFGIDYLFAASAEIVYAGNSSKLYKSTDGGITWNTGTSISANGVYFLDTLNGFSYGGLDIGTMQRTTDGGTTFKSITLPSNTKALNIICFSDSLHGFAVGAGGTSIMTTNGGETWISGGSFGGDLRALYFLDNLTGWVATRTGVMGKTTDGGISWTGVFSFPQGQRIRYIKFFDALNGIVCRDSALITTGDGGISWHELEHFSTGVGYSAAFSNLNYGWIAGSSLWQYDSVNPLVALNSPIPGQTLQSGDSVTVSWSSSLGSPTTLSLSFSPDSGETWNTLLDEIPSTQSTARIYIPVLISSKCFLKLTAKTEPALQFVLGPFYTVLANSNSIGTISANEIKQYLQNNGSSSYNPNSDKYCGLYWPGGVNAAKSLVFEDGIIWGGMTNHELKVGGSTYNYGLQPGNILQSGLAADPLDTRFSVWKLKKNWESLPQGTDRDQYQYSYENWPMDLGAPYEDVNEDGTYTPGTDKPKYLGDETLWFVANDLNPALTTMLYGSQPIGVEMQVSEFAFSSNDLKDVLFKKVKLLNKSAYPVTDMYLSIWSDVDLGYYRDDFIGCDTSLGIGYVYNGSAIDGDGTSLAYYGANPPALGYVALQTPMNAGSPTDSAFSDGKYIKGYKNTSMSSFTFFVDANDTYKDPDLGTYSGTIQVYNNMTNKFGNGKPFLDPRKSPPSPVNFCLYGDPVSGTGWYEGAGWPAGQAPGDRRMLMSYGPFTFAPGQVQELVYAICIAQGTSNINSVTAMKQLCAYVKSQNQRILTDVKPAIVKAHEFKLEQNYPNPFNPVTVIRYEVPSSGAVTLKVFDVLGKEVTTLVNEVKNAGSYSAQFNAANLPSGVYFYVLHTGASTRTMKMMLLK